MKPMRVYERAVVILVAVALLAGGAAPTGTAQPAGPPTTGGAADQAAEVARLKDEIEHLKGMVPDQSHVMKDGAYHFSNQWFAGQAQNWPLAGFYLNETRSHLSGGPYERVPCAARQLARSTCVILDGMDRSLLAGVQKTIEARNTAAFSKAYRDALSGCYACHQASEKPYLRPRVPDAPEGRMIEFSPSRSGS